MAAGCSERTRRWDERFRYRKRWARTALLFALDLGLSLSALQAALLLRFGPAVPAALVRTFWNWALLLFLLQFLSLVLFRLYSIQLRFVGILELLRLLQAFLVSTIAAVLIERFFIRPAVPDLNLSLAVLILDGLLAFLLFGASRLTRRILLEFIPRGRSRGKPTLIVGANHKTERLIKELRLPGSKLEPVLVVDTEAQDMGGHIFDLAVIDSGTELTREIRRRRVEAALINLPEAGCHQLEEIFNRLNRSGVNDIRIVPRMDEWRTSIHAIRRIEIEDLLAREPVRIDTAAVAGEFAERSVLITGAAGSIGSEIVRRLHALGARRLAALDVDETGIFHLQQEFQSRLRPGDHLAFVVGSVRDDDKMRSVLARFQPRIVFHAAAYKHVPLMEDFPEEALRTNVLATCRLARLAKEQGVDKFVNISTDKVVNPRGAMGASKRLAEMACQALNGDGTAFLSVRFGNVLGSRGSVVPIFQEQIRRGGPITLTHPDMQRYFMSIPEAVLLVFQAAHQGRGGEVLVLDMGNPVRIRELAESLIRLNGLEPGRDIEIVVTGLRPGEKLFEELLTAEEGVDASSHGKIFIARFSDRQPPGFVDRLLADCQAAGNDRERIHALFAAYIPSYGRD